MPMACYVFVMLPGMWRRPLQRLLIYSASQRFASLPFGGALPLGQRVPLMPPLSFSLCTALSSPGAGSYKGGFDPSGGPPGGGLNHEAEFCRGVAWYRESTSGAARHNSRRLPLGAYSLPPGARVVCHASSEQYKFCSHKEALEFLKRPESSASLYRSHPRLLSSRPLLRPRPRRLACRHNRQTHNPAAPAAVSVGAPSARHAGGTPLPRPRGSAAAGRRWPSAGRRSPALMADRAPRPSSQFLGRRSRPVTTWSIHEPVIRRPTPRAWRAT